MSFNDTDATAPADTASTTTHQETIVNATAGSTDSTSAATDQGVGNELQSILQQRVDDGQAFIQQLKDENASMRDSIKSLELDVQKNNNVDELLERMQHQEEPNQSTQPTVNSGDIVAQVRSELTQESNMAKVEKALQQAYGDEYKKVVVIKGGEIGMSPEEIDYLCYNKPEAALKLFGKGEAMSMTAPTTSSVQTSSVATNTSGVKDRTYYKELMKSDPKTYWKPEVQKEYRNFIIAGMNTQS